MRVAFFWFLARMPLPERGVHGFLNYWPWYEAGEDCSLRSQSPAIRLPYSPFPAGFGAAKIAAIRIVPQVIESE